MIDLVDISMEIDAPVDTVFGLFSTAAGLCRWMAVDAVVDLRQDGSWRWVHDNGNACSGQYVAVDPPHHLSFTYGWESGDFADVAPGSTRVDVAFRAVGDRTHLTLRHSALPGDRAVHHEQGWTHFLGLLAAHAASITNTGAS